MIEKSDIDYILSPVAIRERSRLIFDMAIQGMTQFKVNWDKMDETCDFVLQVIREKYPDFNIPFHSRNGHLNAGNIDRLGELERLLGPVDDIELAKTKIDLIVVSVLLDAGAGDRWFYAEESSHQTFQRSEGLAVASYHMFKSGIFSGLKELPFRAGALGLRVVTEDRLKKFFQVSDANVLLGTSGRVLLLNELGKAIEKNPKIFKTGRVGDLIDHLTGVHGTHLKASHVLDFVLRFFGEIWPSRIRLANQNLGDVWSYSPLGTLNSVESLIPFHKLSQWLTYSILVPMIELGMEISAVDELTGLAEYRNGGLLIDTGLISARDPKILELKHAVQSETVIEWRAITIVLLDMIADKIRENLRLTKEELPLAKVLEGGTWHAGRKIAKQKRPNGAPPISVVSDGTVF